MSLLLSLPPVLDEPRPVPDAVATIGFGIVGLATFVYYVLGIRRGFLDKRPTIPVLAVVTNVCWELVFSFGYTLDGPLRVGVWLWLPLDLVLLYQALRYGRKDFAGISAPLFAWMVVGWAVFSVLFITFVTREFDDRDSTYTQVFVPLFMEAMFVVMLRQRRSTVGQTMYFASLKMLVDVAGGIALIAMYPGRWLVTEMAVAEWAFDVIYFVALWRTFLAEGRRPWRKV